MRNTISACIKACLAFSLVITASCNSSEELLSPLSYRHITAKSKGGIKFMDDIRLVNTTEKKLKMTVGEKTPGKEISLIITDKLLGKYAEKMETFPDKINNYVLYRFIDEWYGVKYCYGGSDKSGIDCSAFVQKLYEEVFCTDLLRTAAQQFHMCKIVLDADKLKEGDLVFFKTRGRRISHVGIYLANNYFVHASRSSGVMISCLDDAYWARRYAGAGKIPRVDKGEAGIF